MKRTRPAPPSLTPPAVVLMLLASMAPAQLSYAPGTSGNGGFVPNLSCGQAYMGNLGFSLDIRNADGGALAWVGASFATGNTPFAGATIWIDLNPANNFLLMPVPLSGSAGAAGAGTASLPYAINLPVTPSLAGLTVYAQALIDEGGIFAATNALEVVITMPPRILIGTSVGGNADPFYVVDPTVPVLAQQFNGPGAGAIPAPINNTTDAEFAYAGRRAYVGQSIGNAVQEINFDTNPPTWSTFHPALGSTYGIGIDHDNKRLYTFDGASAITGEIIAIDCDLNSATYGQTLASTTALASSNGYVERWEISPDGKRAAMLTVFSRQLILIDTDPTSTNYMGWTNVGIIPVGPAVFPLPTGVDFTPDGLQLMVSLQTGGGAPGEVARYDVLLAQWIDHNPTMIGTQNIGLQSSPPATIPSAPWEPTYAPDGTFAVVSGWGGAGGLAKIDIDPGNPFVWSASLFTSPLSLANASWACAVSPDSRQVATYSTGGLVIFNADGTFVGSVVLPGAGNVYTIKWHE